MSVNYLSQFLQALQQCDACQFQCTTSLPPTELTRAVRQVVAELAPAGWTEAAQPTAWPPRTLLLVLTYSYACGVFGSRQIAEDLEDRADRCALVKHVAIEASTLAQFRRENRALLRRCLARLLTRREGLERAARAGTGRGGGTSLRPPSRRLEPEAEAERRIVLAAQTDSEDLDL
jgi:hypothetical protein